MRAFLLIFTMDINFVLLYLKLLAFAFLLKSLLCLLLVPHAKLTPLLDVHQPQITFGKILIYLVNICLHLIIF
jgi:hypothetical protein